MKDIKVGFIGGINMPFDIFSFINSLLRFGFSLGIINTHVSVLPN